MHSKSVESTADTSKPDESKVVGENGKFLELPRFVRDGTSKLSNFINGRNGEGKEWSSIRVSVDTNTHTSFADRLCGTNEATVTIVDEISKSLMGRSGINASRPRTATSRSLLSNDTRHDLIQPPYPDESLGPGSYDIELGSPSVGPVRPDSPTRTNVPSRDPLRNNASFISPVRPELFKINAAAAHLTSYLNANFKGLGNRAPEWYKSTDKRASVSDYRYGTRFSELRKQLPSVPSDYEATIGVGGLPNTVSSTVAAKPRAVPFMSKQPRFAVLPNLRHNDVRLGSYRNDEDPGGNGPGSYGPFLSIGAAKRPTYRLFNDGQPGSSTYGLSRKKLVPLYSAIRSVSGASTSFTATTRVQKFGPFDMFSDSTLTRRPL
ncbi:hypothetical protein CEUSTIGMA_g117.t1 [Chlamydomonas eustigma]|uniref:Uncharacterized protein n=1 Tax=Chlamydomonas eustigma TaxID=1157962 RepID=A0A250WPE6_9CHLO|nr:hypothetical protein CEUSTIGMA_g117.t1 [Chlamydomonas eustigma]|eukprot:GAX72661.1 hypothetical protein CEUSTIGMA_g117.t1 [Chlamydomonas eustigma]